MVSVDPVERNTEFAESLKAKHVVLSDPEGRVGRRFGVVDDDRTRARRRTFYIDAEGKVRAIDRQVKVDSAGQDIARKLAELGFPRRSP